MTKEGAEQTAKSAVVTLGTGARDRAVKRLGKEAGEHVTRELGEGLARKSGERVSGAPWLFGNWLDTSKAALRKKLMRLGTVEVTQPVRVLFRATRGGRIASRKMTGLEPRLFMRRDARVFVRLDWNTVARTKVGRVLVAFLRETAESGLMETALASGTGEQMVNGVGEGVGRVGEDAGDWERNVSAWWLSNAAGVLDAEAAAARREDQP